MNGVPPRLSVVVPVCDEEESLPALGARLIPVLDSLGGDAEVILVDDGSRDRSYPLMLELVARDPRFKIVQLSRNFGHQVALTAGIDHSLGDAVITMDGDLQHPPELIPDLVARWQEGFEVVEAARDNRSRETRSKRLFAHLFYRLLGRLSEIDVEPHVADFRLVDRKAVEAFRALRESNRYLRGMFSWVGFRHTTVPYAAPQRFAGTPKYTLRRLWSLAAEGLVSFSNVPLRVALHIGFAISLLAFLYGLTAIGLKLFGVYAPPGWASLAVVISFLAGFQLITLGMVGVYIGRIYEEVKQRPLYVVRQLRGFEARAHPRGATEAPGIVSVLAQAQTPSEERPG